MDTVVLCLSHSIIKDRSCQTKPEKEQTCTRISAALLSASRVINGDTKTSADKAVSSRQIYCYDSANIFVLGKKKRKKKEENMNRSAKETNTCYASIPSKAKQFPIPPPPLFCITFFCQYIFYKDGKIANRS